MKDVKRYDPGCDYAGQDEMVESVDGVYVKYSDYAALKAERDALAAIAQRVIDTGELARPEHEWLEAEICALVAQAARTVSDAGHDFEALIMLISRGLADVEKGINGYHDPQIQVFWENYQYSKGLCDEVEE